MEGIPVDKDLTAQIQGLTTLLHQAEQEARHILRTARAHGITFDLASRYLDEDIAHLAGRAHYMQLLNQHAPADSAPLSHRATKQNEQEDTQEDTQEDDTRASEGP